ncbi:MAG TPA: TIM barrel protein, partial [Thermomicrobiaceae bacterium]|nr:TIM barrel protein [Thermomicrobiaceae bacterium]
MPLLGNSGSPRWHDGRFEDYLDLLEASGATLVELPLHHGPFDERTARVHVLESDWDKIIAAYRDRGIAVQLHASLDPRFASERWHGEPEALRREYEPLLRLLAELAPEQAVTTLVLHGAADPALTPAENERATLGLLDWLAERLAPLPGARVALELTARKPHYPTAAATDRASVLRIIETLAAPNAGICWDLAHDLQNAAAEPGWTPVPDHAFLRQVRHIHLHDLDHAGVAHFPLVLGGVPYPKQLGALARLGPLPPITMEIRWRCAARLGDPWSLLADSYRRVEEELPRLG